MRRIRPDAASTALATAAAVPAAPYRKPSSKREMPTTAATTGLATVTVASGAVSPAPRYAAWDSSSPAAARTAIAARSGHRAPRASGAKDSATDLVNTEAIPKTSPAAAASSTLCSTARCIRCAARNSTATPAPVTISNRFRSAPARLCSARPSPPVSASSPARPAVASTAPRQAAVPARRPTKYAAIGSANTMVSAPSGWTRLSGP
ncbi:hypothetical protein KPP03845_106297 [Streptomyces xanthophaeus]|nr:hypothetical protein KPP03845_106297 [Streptomyces xanthophaeus]